MKKSENIEEIAKSLIEFRKNLKQPQKDANNPFFKSSYTTLDKVIEAIDETAPEFGLSFTQWAVTNDNGNVGVETLLLHTSGQFIQYDPLYMKPEKNTPQAIGSCITYSRRYSISAIFGITSDEDDDGNQATGNYQKNNYQQRNTQQKQQPRATRTNDNKLPVQDKGKLLLAQQKATDLADVINSQDDADENNPITQEKILNGYVNKVGVTDLSKATNEQLINIVQLIDKNIEKYKNK
ncbi:putative single-stranded DNA-binding protein 1 [uncultured Caudovirales phage]|uniref:Putative single-stranded DNA-binding protein 1 n=1 Tax=uncultured Caudovirales phage TaxID=2100421 RepID=A0A2H4J439_9CAUD|nr:putative single-stranded DNA-binding protein 1 [uncultured Caudovirales phage]